jgi:hypothetical protein
VEEVRASYSKLSFLLRFRGTEGKPFAGRWERERNEWEIERADLRSRIALLEGVKRSSENAKTDLNRRVKMLEYALKQERWVYTLFWVYQNGTDGGMRRQSDPSH